MVKIINSKFIYSWDTEQSLSERIAAKMTTLPKYVYFIKSKNFATSIEDMKKGMKAQIGDFLKDLKTSKSVDIVTNILNGKNIPNFIISSPLDPINDLLKPFIAYNKMLEGLSVDDRGVIFLLLKTMTENKVIKIKIIWDNRNLIKEQFESEIMLNKTRVKQSDVLFKIKGVKFSPFVRKEISLRLEYDLKNLSLLEVFDLIKLTPEIPYASVNNLYKILRDFYPNPDWESGDNFIYLKCRSGIDKFIDALLILEGNPGEEKGIIQTGLIKNTIKPESIIKNIEDIFTTPLDLVKNYIDKEKGKFYYYLGDKPIDTYVLGDLVLNDPIFSQYLSIDEHEAATKGKRSSTYIYFFDGSEQILKGNITLYKTRFSDEVHDVYDYPIGKYYLSILVSDVSNEANLNKFTVIFSKLLKLYFERAPKIIKFYQSLLTTKFPPNYRPRALPPKGKKENIPLSKQAKDVFVSGYPTKCGNPPRIITAQEAKKTDKIVMQYPKSDSEGFQQRWYVCDNDRKFIYPGLRTNDLINNDLVPYLPCCFKSKQDFGPKVAKGIQTKIYGHYFYGLPLTDKTGSSKQSILLRDIFTNPPEYATLPKEVGKMLNLISYKKGCVGVTISAPCFPLKLKIKALHFPYASILW